MGTHLNFDLIINSGIDVQLDNREIRGSMGGEGGGACPKSFFCLGPYCCFYSGVVRCTLGPGVTFFQVLPMTLL